MKNKKLTYFLLLMVIIVWGLIIYRVVDTTGNNDNGTQIASTSTVKEPYNDYTMPKDTTHLLLNYRDPFGLTTFKDTVKAKAHSTIKKMAIAKPALNWDFIKYLGYMRNPDSKKLIAILTINGKSTDLTEGETIDKVKLIQNKRDSVKVLFDGKTKFITLQH